MAEHQIETRAPTFRADIFIAGDAAVAKMICRSFCFSQGLCVNVSETTFIYTGGEETGVRVGLINYPRFPASAADIEAVARRLGQALMEGLHQHSFSVVTDDETTWVSRREAPKPTPLTARDAEVARLTAALAEAEREKARAMREEDTARADFDRMAVECEAALAALADARAGAWREGAEAMRAAIVADVRAYIQECQVRDAISPAEKWCGSEPGLREVAKRAVALPLPPLPGATGGDAGT